MIDRPSRHRIVQSVCGRSPPRSLSYSQEVHSQRLLLSACLWQGLCSDQVTVSLPSLLSLSWWAHTLNSLAAIPNLTLVIKLEVNIKSPALGTDRFAPLLHGVCVCFCGSLRLCLDFCILFHTLWLYFFHACDFGALLSRCLTIRNFIACTQVS